MQFIIAQYQLNIIIQNSQTNIYKTNKKRVLGGMEEKIWISEDFDEPLNDFKEYM